MVDLVDTTGSNPVDPSDRAGSTPAKSTKICSKCGKRKTVTRFSFKIRGKRQASCKSCQAVYAKKHYALNKKSYKTAAKRSHVAIRERNRRWIHAQKVGRACMDCEREYPAICMDFDHRAGTDKVATVSQLVLSFAPLATMKKEIEKCDLICSNCHRVRTFKRLHRKRGLPFYTRACEAMYINPGS